MLVKLYQIAPGLISLGPIGLKWIYWVKLGLEGKSASSWVSENKLGKRNKKKKFFHLPTLTLDKLYYLQTTDLQHVGMYFFL